MPTRSSNHVSIQIMSDGEPGRTVIIGPDGKEIKNVLSFYVSGEAREMVRASIEIMMPIADITAMVNEVTFLCPCCTTKIQHECYGSNTVETPLGT